MINIGKESEQVPTPVKVVGQNFDSTDDEIRRLNALRRHHQQFEAPAAQIAIDAIGDAVGMEDMRLRLDAPPRRAEFTDDTGLDDSERLQLATQRYGKQASKVLELAQSPLFVQPEGSKTADSAKTPKD